MKKLTICLVLLSLCMFSFAGCTKTDEPTPPADTSATDDGGTTDAGAATTDDAGTTEEGSDSK